jgi:predicted XRE-type DNA-binding protein
LEAIDCFLSDHVDRLAVGIVGVIDDRRLSRAAAARALKINQPGISALKSYKLDRFSVERVMTFRIALGLYPGADGAATLS